MNLLEYTQLQRPMQFTQSKEHGCWSQVPIWLSIQHYISIRLLGSATFSPKSILSFIFLSSSYSPLFSDLLTHCIHAYIIMVKNSKTFLCEVHAFLCNNEPCISLGLWYARGAKVYWIWPGIKRVLGMSIRMNCLFPNAEDYTCYAEECLRMLEMD